MVEALGMGINSVLLELLVSNVAGILADHVYEDLAIIRVPRNLVVRTFVVSCVRNVDPIYY